MAQAVLYGTGSSFAAITASGCLFNAFSFSVTQGTTTQQGFGDMWQRCNGTINGWSVTASGGTTKGTTNDVFGSATLTRTGGTITGTYLTGCTLSGTAVPTGISAASQFLGNVDSTYTYMGNGALTETWATT